MRRKVSSRPIYAPSAEVTSKMTKVGGGGGLELYILLKASSKKSNAYFYVFSEVNYLTCYSLTVPTGTQVMPVDSEHR